MTRNLFHFTLFLILFSAACSKPDPDAVRLAAFDEIYTKMKTCVPESEPQESIGLAILSVSANQNETIIRIVAYAPAEPAEFNLPVYSLSRGRWLINNKDGEKDRTYLIDDRCREFKLKDRRPAAGMKIPLAGKISLDKGQSFETSLIFPSISEKSRVLVLVYGGRTMRHLLWPDERRSD